MLCNSSLSKAIDACSCNDKILVLIMEPNLNESQVGNLSNDIEILITD